MSERAGGEHILNDYLSTDEIFKRVLASADEEIDKSARLLFMDGLAAGLSIGLTFMARAAVTAQVPDAWAQLIGNLLYPIGFILIVLGRYQLFTENTLTPVTLVLTRIASVPLLLRNWGIVLGANVLGAGILALVLANTGILDPEVMATAAEFGRHGLELDWWTLFWKGIIAGWLVASMVWLIHAVKGSLSRFIIVFFVMFIIPTTDLFHCVVGACEVLFLVFRGDAVLLEATLGFFLPVLLGNTIGGVLLVAILNYAQTSRARFPERKYGNLVLSWKEWLLGTHKSPAVHYENQESNR